MSGSDPMTSHAPVVRPPKQARSRKTLERIESAALALIGESGVDGASVTDIARRAQSSVGSFYGRFGGKEDLLRHLNAGLWKAAQARWDLQESSLDWPSLDLNERAERIVRLLYAVLAEDFGVRNALGEHPAIASLAREEAAAFDRHVGGRVRTLLGDRALEIRHEDPTFALGFGFELMSAGIRQLLRPTVGSDDDPPRDREGELTRVLLGYLGSHQPGVEDDTLLEEPESTGDVEFFDIWEDD